MTRSFISLILLIFVISVASAETLYVQSKSVKILDKPQFKADVLAVANSGDPLQSLDGKGRWVKVDYQGVQGWLPKLVVSDTPPLEKKSILGDESDELMGNVRRRASATASVAAARGLRSDGRARQSDDAVANYGALEKMEQLSVDEQEILKFMQEGSE
jgi:hypothetical protein